MDGSRGQTLPELMFTLAIVAGLAGWAVPAFHDAGLNAARTREVNQFVQAVHLARGEAIKRSAVVSLCPSADGTDCAPAGASWHGGWIAFVNLDRDSPAVRDPGEELLQAYPPWPRGRILANRNTLSFRSFGQSGVTATFAFCDDRGSREARAVILSQTGRPRVSDRTSSGDPIECP